MGRTSRRGSRVGLVGLMLALLAGCGGGNGSARPEGREPGGPVRVEATFAGSQPIDVVCTTGMVADLAEHVGGRHVRVSALMGEGVDPHRYKASPGDVSRLGRADLIFYSGLHLEGKMADVFARLARRKPTFAVTEYVAAHDVLTDENGAHDPHLWFDVALWARAVDVVRDVLMQLDPPHADEYRTNAAAYRAELAQLHEYAKTELARVPQERRVLVTAHDAFRYFGRAYGVEVLGIQGISTESEAAVKRVNELVDFLTRRQVKAVFVESSVPERNVRSLVEGCEARGHKVAVGGELFSDAMGKPGTPAGTYAGMVRHNVDTIVRALK